ncbi:MAG: peptidylprolyl isomerase [Verrucomicrobiae bacterium]|nr:peptidylprolyl isomerase [Verrucomicrobiae bacterium]
MARRALGRWGLVSLLVAWLVPAVAGPLAVFRTALGEMEVELFEDKPVTTANFVRYVQSGAYSNLIFHRWVPGFVMQGGGFYVAQRGTTNAQLAYVPSYGPITNEFHVGRRVSNTYGTLAMAKVSGDPHSATSQWFFNLGDNSANLDNQNGGFTVFGRVVRGAAVLERFNDVSATHSLWLLNLGAPLDELPVLSSTPGYEDLVYCEIRLLRVGIRRVAQGLEVSWAGVAGVTNVVEWRRPQESAWQTWMAVPGGSGTLRVTNAPPGEAGFFRVRGIY